MCETVKINLFDLFTTNEKTKTEELEYISDEFHLANATYPVASKSPIKLEFHTFETGKVRLSGSFNIELLIPCDRCLDDVSVNIKCDFDSVLFSETISGYEENDDNGFLQGNDFDVYDFVNSNVLMNMPSKDLCQEDCKGLCPVCGCNKNKTACECDTFVPDPRMAVISDIFNANKDKEV